MMEIFFSFGFGLLVKVYGYIKSNTIRPFSRFRVGLSIVDGVDQLPIFLPAVNFFDSWSIISRPVHDFCR